MPIVTTYTCDRCKHSQTTCEQMWTLGIYLTSANCTYHTAYETPTKSVLWCRACVESIGLLCPTGKPAEQPAPAPTIEDMIRAIAREEK